MKKVLLFGTFDGVHEGHRALFAQAREHGDHLSVVVARDTTVTETKGRTPLLDENQRALQVESEDLIDFVCLGYTTDDKHAIIRDLAPHTIVLGYDQSHFIDSLQASLTKFGLPTCIVRAQPFSSETYKSSLINNHKHKILWDVE